MRKTDIAFWMAAFILILIATVNLTLNKRIQDEVLLIAKKQDRDEQVMEQALFQAVTRWERLQDLNPSLNVPKVVIPTPTPDVKP